MIDLQTVKDSYNKQSQSFIYYSGHNFADHFTKTNANVCIMTALGFGKHSHPMHQCITRNAIIERKNSEDGSVDKFGGVGSNFTPKYFITEGISLSLDVML